MAVKPEYIPPDFPKDAFQGTASYYSQYRVPYLSSLIQDLVDRAGGSSGGRLLDLASGPGRLALPLAARFDEVVAVDLEPEMIEEGKRLAKERGIANIRWIVGKAEEFQAEPASFRLITIGEAFHRLDQWAVSRQAMKLLVPGGCLALIGCREILDGTEPWQRIVNDTIRKWRASASLNGRVPRPQPKIGPEHNRLVLADAGFQDVASYSFAQEHTWTVESIVGYLCSTSICSGKALGELGDAFADDLRTHLLDYDSGGRYRSTVECGYSLGRKPAE